MPVLEVKIEDKVVDWAKVRGILVLKLNVRGQTGYPDRIFFIPGGRPFLIEFKRPGEELEPRQWYIMEQLLNLDYDVEAHNDAELAIAALRKRLEAARLSKGGREVSRQ